MNLLLRHNPDLTTEAEEEMQLHTITMWCNKHLSEGQRIENLEEEFWDGTKLSALVESLLLKGNLFLMTDCLFVTFILAISVKFSLFRLLEMCIFLTILHFVFCCICSSINA